MESTKVTLNDMPEEMVIKVMDHCADDTICCLRQTNTGLNRMTQDVSLWKRRIDCLLTQYDMNVPLVWTPDDDVQSVYRQLCHVTPVDSANMINNAYKMYMIRAPLSTEISDVNLLLNSATLSNSAELVAVLLRIPDANPFIANQHGIINAAANGYVKVVGMLMKHPLFGPFGAEDDYHPLISAATEGGVDTLDHVLSDTRFDNDRTELKNDVLLWACDNNLLEIVNYLLADPLVDPNARNGLIIECALRHPVISDRLMRDPRFHLLQSETDQDR